MRMRRSRIFLLLLTTFTWVFLLEGVPLSAQTAFVPYFGKNSIRYTKFAWKIY